MVHLVIIVILINFEARINHSQPASLKALFKQNIPIKNRIFVSMGWCIFSFSASDAIHTAPLTKFFLENPLSFSRTIVNIVAHICLAAPHLSVTVLAFWCVQLMTKLISCGGSFHFSFLPHVMSPATSSVFCNNPNRPFITFSWSSPTPGDNNSGSSYQ